MAINKYIHGSTYIIYIYIYLYIYIYIYIYMLTKLKQNIITQI